MENTRTVLGHSGFPAGPTGLGLMNMSRSHGDEETAGADSRGPVGSW
ncbi:hypothetical protein [Streptomyces sp. NPDC057052]